MQFESEWLETNGTGGFACGTVSGEVRRKWHGLLWMARKPPRSRIRLIAGTEEYLRHPQMVMSLTSTWRQGAWRFPSAWPSQFDPFPTPHWTWELEGGATLHRFVFMERGSTDAVVVGYRLDPSPTQNSVVVSVRPLFPAPLHESVISETSVHLGDLAGYPLYLHSSRELHFLHHDEPLGEVVLETEKDCESKWTEELFAGPELSFKVRVDEPVFLVYTTQEKVDTAKLQEAYRGECTRRCLLSLPHLSEAHAPRAIRLAAAADQFVVSSGTDGLSTIMAGYPWFTDWGRDTMISLPGLCIATGRKDEARSIMQHFLKHMDRGVIPNIFPEEGAAPMYNTVDATLWLVEAYFRSLGAEGLSSDSEDWRKLKEIVHYYRIGTHNNIHIEEDGLVYAGTAGSQLTWMDVKVNGEVPTPRHGKPVEIQGLWYNALLLIAEEAERLGETAYAKECRELAALAAASFKKRFVVSGEEAIADVVDRDGPGTADFSLRPNMVIPFSLSNNIIPQEKRADVLRAAARELVTPRGLRSLAPSHTSYKPHYRGVLLERDRAYHQGTVWLWLIWPYMKGVFDEREHVPELFEQAHRIVAELVYHFEKEGCLNQCSEVFDAEAPHTPRGCFAQAWSLAALIEVLKLELGDGAGKHPNPAIAAD